MTELLRHCQSGQVSRDEIAIGPGPPRSRKKLLVSHHRLLQTVESAVKRRGFKIANQVHCRWGEKRQYFGLLELVDADSAIDYGIILGVQNSYEGALQTSLILGHQVQVNDNLTFFEQHVLNPHGAPITEQNLPRLVGKAMTRLVSERRCLDQRIEAFKATEISDRTAHDLMIRALDAEVIRAAQLQDIINEWHMPCHEEFLEHGRSVWRLFNAFTASFNGLWLAAVLQRSRALYGLMPGISPEED